MHTEGARISNLNYIYSEVPPGLNFLLRPDYCHDKEIERCIKQNRKGNTPEVAAPDELDILHAPNAETANPSLCYTSRVMATLEVSSLLSKNLRRPKPAA